MAVAKGKTLRLVAQESALFAQALLQSRDRQPAKATALVQRKCSRGAGRLTHHETRADGLVKLDPNRAPISTAVGVLGMPGFTAYIGLLEFGRPTRGETVVVSAASGAVGQVVGQLARMNGCRVVGVAGAADKCRYVVDQYGFDACVNHRSDDFEGQLSAACPDGIDVYFENQDPRP